MQFSHQSPEEEDDQRRASQPLYEFSTDPSLAAPPSKEPAGSSQQAVPQEAAGDKGTPQATEEAIRQGLIYPPPPSFYQNVQPPSEQFSLPPLPTSPSAAGPSSPTQAPPAGLAETQLRHGVVAVQPPPFVPPLMAPQPLKHSRRWIWTAVALLIAVLLVSCGLCSWASYTLFSANFQEATAAFNVVNDYYEAIRSESYPTAYKYLSPQGTISGLTIEQFTQQARSRDNQYGPVQTFVTDQSSLGNASGMNLSHLTITLNVSRARQKNYTVVLTLQKMGGSWKIVEYNSI